ncbi:MAG: beta-ketoacyl-[Bacteroidaceae bacterium]|nr:beta-ketoacyl-[acyl-carrier-protein] synthase family protein [Bacteroidaceae bacterium]
MTPTERTYSGPQQRRVAVTGMGIWSCLGQDKAAVAAALRAGRSGIGIDAARTAYGYQSALTGIVARPDLKALLHRRLRASMSEEAAYAYMAGREALGQAGIDDDYLLHNEVGIIFGNDSSAQAVIEGAGIMAEKHDSQLVGSGLVFQSMNSTVSMNLATIFHLRGINLTISAACASGSHSIGMAAMLIRQGLQHTVLAGGAQETNHYSMASFDALGVFSRRMDAPTKASRPFDRDRDGLVPSGGAAALVLEDYDHAIGRGATILAEVAGYGFSSNGGGISQPSDTGCLTAMQRAMADAGVAPSDIDYVNAHATSTPQGDMHEAMALTQLFGACHTPISSTKGMTGHECWMAGASEAIYCILMMQNRFVAPNINLEHPDPYAETLNLVRQTAEGVDLNLVLSNSFGFGGTNAALLLKKPLTN